MNPTMGVGAMEAIASAGSGTVIAVFGRAAYVRFPAGVVALTAPGVHRGPIHLSSDLDLSRLRTGARFEVPDGWARMATVWRGRLPRPGAAAGHLLASVARRSALLAPPHVDRWLRACGQDDLAAACRILGGLGPGLTPSGDDALAGMFLAARLRSPAAEPTLVAQAKTVDTHEIGRAFLLWAAKGQCIEPVHRLLAGERAAAGDLLAYGHTSGADVALGLQFGLTAPWRETSGSAPPGGC